MTEFQLSRIRFTWKGPWVASTSYTKDDIVQYGGKSYVCLIGNTATSNFNTDLASAYWSLWFDGYTWKNTWTANTIYSTGDIVNYGGIVYICSTNHTSASSASLASAGGLEANQSSWTAYAITESWKSIWTASTQYKVKDVVLYGGTLYICTTAHISAATATPPAGGLELNLSSWAIFSVSDDWKTDWTPTTAYKANDLVRYGGILYRCTTGHTSATYITPTYLGLENDLSKWAVVHNGIQYLSTYNGSSYRYKANDVITYGANAWICSTYHVSSSTFNPSYWTLYTPGQEFLNAWVLGTTYQLGDVVRYGGYTYTSKTSNNTGNIPSTSSTNWLLLTQQYNIQGEWSNTTSYKVGSLVRKNGYLYVATADSTATSGPWISTTTYPTGTVVTYNNFTFISKTSGNLNNIPTTGIDANWAIMEPTNTNYWSVLVPGRSWKNIWANSTRYSIGDIVSYKGTSFECVLGHVASVVNTPNNTGSSSAWWKTLVQGDEFDGLLQVGDLPVYASSNPASALLIGTYGNVLKSTGTDPSWSNFGAVPGVYYVSNTTGTDSLTNGTTINSPWKTIAYACAQVAAGTLYTNANYLLKTNKAWAVAEMYNWMIYQNKNNLSPFTTSSSYDPQKTQRDAEYIVDALVYDMGRGGNSQTVAAASAYFIPGTNTFINTTVASEMPYFIAALNYLQSLLLNVISNTTPATNYQLANNVSSTSLSITNVTSSGTQVVISFATQITEPFSIGETITVSGVIPSTYNGTYIVSTVTTSSVTFLSTVVDAFIGGTPSVVGSAINQTINLSYTAETSAAALVTNLTNIIIYALTNQTTINIPPANQGLTATIFIKTGTYQEILPISVPENTALVGDELRTTIVQPSSITASFNGSINNGSGGAGTILTVTSMVSGSNPISIGMYISSPVCTLPTQIIAQVSGTPGGVGIYTVNFAANFNSILIVGGYSTANMFYVRNGSGIRNMTLSGITGVLQSPNIYRTSRPNAGAYVSLDPGTGPTDTSVWIFRKSPYVQNVTTFGTACVGLKIDGTLHNGGNKSIVANDFTQVLSDGIGCWCTGSGALTELVSVFTYYNAVGYLADAGGRIRATNGNCSYGTYGAIAEGYDNTEIPLTPIVNNRATQAQVAEVFAGQAQNKILALEFSNFGQNYTTASYSFTGAGTGVSVIADEFRDNAIFETRITGTSIAAGGNGYLTAGNNAQGGTSSTIVFASNDQNLPANYLGMRVFITSGTGVGQYGYIQAYNSSTKTATIYADSTSLAGWDNILPGTPVASTLDSTTVYSIEARVVFSDPAYTSTSGILPIASSWSSIVYSNGYYVAVDQGGNSLYSTNGTSWTSTFINAAVYTSLAAGKISGTTYYVTVAAGATTVAYSTTPGVWIQSTLPISDLWSSVAFGNNKFIAIGATYTAYTTTGTSWIQNGSLPSTTTWCGVVYGSGPGTWVAVAGQSVSTQTAAYSTNDGGTWTLTTMPVSAVWTSVSYGNGRFVAIASGGTVSAYSFDGITWIASNGLPSTQNWSTVSYAQGLFFAVALSSTIGATSQDGLNWLTRLLPQVSNWVGIAFGNPTIGGLVTPIWVAITGGAGQSTSLTSIITAGATARGRTVVASGKISSIRMWEPGSSYSSTPTATITDPNIALSSGTAATTLCRTATGVLGNPSFTNRGNGYQTSTTKCTLTGDGFSDSYQISSYLTLNNLTALPAIGSNLVITGVSTVYKIVLNYTSLVNGVATLQITPDIDRSISPVHGQGVTIRQKYSQVRLTGHDFLLIGTGNFSNTNYPNVDVTTANQTFQTVENNTGRVFYTSTNQDGNFNVGGLFGVQQASGIVTLAASVVNIGGITSLTLLGSPTITVNSFSTDSYFLQNSDVVVPTQRAIKAYLSRNIANGGSNAFTALLTAGVTAIGNQRIYNTTGGSVKMAKKVLITKGINGNMPAMTMFLKSGFDFT